MIFGIITNGFTTQTHTDTHTHSPLVSRHSAADARYDPALYTPRKLQHTHKVAITGRSKHCCIIYMFGVYVFVCAGVVFLIREVHTWPGLTGFRGVSVAPALIGWLDRKACRQRRRAGSVCVCVYKIDNSSMPETSASGRRGPALCLDTHSYFLTVNAETALMRGRETELAADCSRWMLSGSFKSTYNRLRW